MAVTWNPSDKSSYITLSNGDLTAKNNYGNSWAGVRANISKSSGKWYWDHTATHATAICGFATSSATLTFPGNDANGYGWYLFYAYKYYNNVWGVYGTAGGNGSIVGVALDLDNGKIFYSKNGTWQGSGNPVTGDNPAHSGISGTFYPMLGLYGLNVEGTSHFKDTDLSYTPPSGYSALEVVATELVDASLFLSAYKQALEDLASWLRAHDGLEFVDLQSLLAAYYQSFSDDVPSHLSAYFQSLDDLQTHLMAAFWELKDISAPLKALGLSRSDLPAGLRAAKYRLDDFKSFFAADSPTVLRDLVARLSATDGTVTGDLGTLLSAIALVPAYRAVTAHRLSSVMAFAGSPVLDDFGTFLKTVSS